MIQTAVLEGLVNAV